MAKVETVSLALSPDMATILKDAVASGAYASASEVVQEALREWREQRDERDMRLEAIKAKIDQAANNPGRLTDAQLGDHFDGLLASFQKKKAW